MNKRGNNKPCVAALWNAGEPAHPQALAAVHLGLLPPRPGVPGQGHEEGGA